MLPCVCIQEGEKLVKKVRGSFLFKVKGDNGKTEEWLIDLKSGKGSVTKSPGKTLLRISK